MSDSQLISVNGLYVDGIANAESGELFTPLQSILIENQVGDATVFAGGIDGWADDLVANNILGLATSDRVGIYMNGVGLAITSGDQFYASNSVVSTSSGINSLAASVVEQTVSMGSGVLELFQSNMNDVPTLSWNQPIGNTPWQAELDAINWHPREAGLNVDWNSLGVVGIPETAAGLSAIQDAQAAGIETVLPIISPNAGVYGDFATDAQWAGARTLALAGGGLEVDSPSNFFMSSSALYRNFVAQEIDWANANNLVSMVLVSPYAIGSSFPQANYDPTFLAATKSLVEYLQANGAVPTQWSVDNYIAYDGSVNQIGSDLDAESVNGVALWLANNAPTTAEPAQVLGENLLSSGRPIVNASVVIDNVDDNTASISSKYGLLSVDGKSLTISGTDTYVRNALSQIQVALTQGSGSADLEITIAAGNATYMHKVHLIGQDPRPLITGVMASAPCQMLDAGKAVIFTVTASEALSVGTSGGRPVLLLSNGATASFVSSIGSNLSFSYTVQAGQDTSDLKITSLGLNGATITDAAGNALNSAALPGLLGSTLVTPSASIAVSLSGFNQSIVLQAGDVLNDSGTYGTIIFPTQGSVTLSGSVLTNSDHFDMRSLMLGTTWSQGRIPLANYFSAAVVDNGADLQISLHPTGGAASSVIATILGQGGNPGLLSTFIQKGYYASDWTVPALLDPLGGSDTSLIIDTKPLSTTTLGPMPDTLDLQVSEDAWQGDAQFMVTVDGTSTGTVYTATASHASGAMQALSIAGRWGAGTHTIGIAFINDAYGGTSTTDRNLYVNQVTYDGQTANIAPVALMSNGVANFTVPVSNTQLTFHLAEDAWQGDAQYSVAIDGKTVIQAETVGASNALGQSQAVDLQAMLTSGMHDLAISFLNDVYGGTAAMERSLYVKGIDMNNKPLSGTAVDLLSTGTTHFQIIIPSN